MHRSRHISLFLPLFLSRINIWNDAASKLFRYASWITVNSQREEAEDGSDLISLCSIRKERSSRVSLWIPCLPYFRFVYRHSHFLCYILASRYFNSWLRLSISLSFFLSSPLSHLSHRSCCLNLEWIFFSLHACRGSEDLLLVVTILLFYSLFSFFFIIPFVSIFLLLSFRFEIDTTHDAVWIERESRSFYFFFFLFINLFFFDLTFIRTRYEKCFIHAVATLKIYDHHQADTQSDINLIIWLWLMIRNCLIRIGLDGFQYIYVCFASTTIDRFFSRISVYKKEKDLSNLWKSVENSFFFFLFLYTNFFCFLAIFVFFDQNVIDRSNFSILFARDH